jgi:hypothetical protein
MKFQEELIVQDLSYMEGKVGLGKWSNLTSTGKD